MIYELYFTYKAGESGRSYASSTFHTDLDNALKDFSRMAKTITDKLPVKDIPQSWGYEVDLGEWGCLDFHEGKGEIKTPDGATYIWKIKKFKDDSDYYNGEESNDE